MPMVKPPWAPTGATRRRDNSIRPMGSGSTERRRSRTYRAVGYTTAPVLKTSWATGPMPLQGAMLPRRGRAPEDALVADTARDAVGVEALEQELGRLARDA